MQDDKIIRIPNTVFDFQISLEKVVKFIHINIYKKLARQIAKRESDARLVFCVKTANYLSEKANYIFISHAEFQNIFQNSVINVCKKFSDVAF